MHAPAPQQPATRSDAPCRWSGDLGPRLDKHADEQLFARLAAEESELDRRGEAR
jgi:hypothetical protein